ncbi:MAG TPA: class I SAM-dependent methyltransferase [Steroidobacteraceae bacterium]|jgi:2-polyprenyl-6-hydroxyphenyl methylase/3-demethylubiquinone-9 3-methyltransferase
MTDSQSLLLQESHFSFGKNWARYATGVGQVEIEEATAALQRLVGGSLAGKTFLDIGCGSGIHALAALRLGASTVLALDIDPDSVATARRMLEAHAPGARWEVREVSVFAVNPGTVGSFDVVYSWGVLHHTGDLSRALRCAGTLVAGDGIFAFALYQKTLCCPLWKVEKRWYAKASARAQRLASAVYTGVYRVGLAVRGRAFGRYVTEYNTKRGMDFHCDVHDWLGGWPYESMSASEVDEALRVLGFERRKMFGTKGMSFGVLGAGCNEYVYARMTG